jgi:hypothetical protein
MSELSCDTAAGYFDPAFCFSRPIALTKVRKAKARRCGTAGDAGGWTEIGGSLGVAPGTHGGIQAWKLRVQSQSLSTYKIHPFRSDLGSVKRDGRESLS